MESAHEMKAPDQDLGKEVAALVDRCDRLETANAQILDLLLGFSSGLLRVRASLLASSMAES